MNKYAIVINGTVVNVALWDGETDWQPDGEFIQLDDDSRVGPGWAYVEGTFVEPVIDYDWITPDA